MLASLCGGSPFPRRVMLRLAPPGKGERHWDEAAVRLALNEWRETARRFPHTWLLVQRKETAEGGKTLSSDEANHLAEAFARADLPPAAVGDVLRHDGETYLLIDTRLQDAVQAALARNGMSGEARRGFDPAFCAREERLAVGLPRLDAMVARAFRIGRAEAKKAVSRGFVALNLRIVRDAGREVTAGDLVYHLLAGTARVLELAAGRSEGRHHFRCQIACSAALRCGHGVN